MSHDGEHSGNVSEDRLREAQIGHFERMNGVLQSLVDSMERMNLRVQNIEGQQQGVARNEGYVDLEEFEDEVTNLELPRRGGLGAVRGRGRGRGHEMMQPRRINREDQYERMEERSGGGVKLKIPSFQGKSDPEAYLQWENKVENVFDCNNFSEERKVKLAITEFSDYASVWWSQLKTSRRRNMEPAIETWQELKATMRKRYVPRYFHRELKNKLQVLRQGSKSVEDYFKEMEILMARTETEEDEETTMSRFLAGLNKDIANQVDLQPYVDLEEMVHLAIKIEKQLQGSKMRYASKPTTTSFNHSWKKDSKVAIDKKEKGESSFKGKGKVEEPKERTRDIKCWKCQGVGHISRDCPNKRTMIVRNGEIISEGEESDNEEVESELEKDSDGSIEEGSKVALVTRRVLSAQVK